MVKIKASKRIRKRYLLVQGESEKISNLILSNKIIWNLRDRIGNLKLKNSVLVVERKNLDRAIESIKKTKGLTLLKVSGTLKGLGVR